ncbi:MAG: type II toxin-antitoxin system HipA family toxin [Rhodobacteraceae bacterium]|nr:type II toxin-antitoxin system HipA family toxin [Paracoccaceae bacterium]
MTALLVVIADQGVMGEIQRDRRGRLTFIYDDRWLSMDAAYPLSLSMPLLITKHEHTRIDPWLRGLLPDSETILKRWGQRFHVSPGNAFSLLSAVGEDCAGAVQLVKPDRVNNILQDNNHQVEWLTETQIAKRLRILGQDQAAWRMEQDVGQFSLAGAQPKTALIFDGKRWGVPSGPTPTTHILKPPISRLKGHSENEHLCLSLARAVGLPAARSVVRRFEDETAIVVERYDRMELEGSIRRIHQEDMCQALGYPPTKKYQNEGGPGCAELSEAIWNHSIDPGSDARAFAHAIILNWIIGGTDAHAKNFSMLIGPQGGSRLAPLYDMASILPYYTTLRKLKMATKIGGEYRLGQILSRHWVRFATEVGLPKTDVIDEGRAIAESLPAILAEIVDDARAKGLDHPILLQMSEMLSARSVRCARILETAAA